MKFNHFIDDFEEDFTSPANRNAHWDKHIKKGKEYNMTPEEYEQAAEDLAKTPCDYKKILGYMSKNANGSCYVKYNKETELFTVYYYKGNEPMTITAFRRSWRDYNSKMYTDEKYPYVDEIPRGK